MSSGRPGRAGGLIPPPPARRKLALASAVALVAAVGAWGILVRPEAPGSHDQASLEIPGGGLLTISEVWPEVMAHAMSGMSVPDQVRPGHRRVALEVTIEVADGPALTFRARDLKLAGEGVAPVRPIRAQPDEAVIPGGAGLAARVVFDVRADATNLVLRIDGSNGELDLSAVGHHPGERPSDATHGHAP